MAVQPTASVFTIARIRFDGSLVVLAAEGAAEQGRCPACGTPSALVPGRYRRHPFALPWRGQMVRCHPRARRFRCRDAACTQVTFAEDFEAGLPRYAAGIA